MVIPAPGCGSRQARLSTHAGRVWPDVDLLVDDATSVGDEAHAQHTDLVFHLEDAAAVADVAGHITADDRPWEKPMMTNPVSGQCLFTAVMRPAVRR